MRIIGFIETVDSRVGLLELRSQFSDRYVRLRVDDPKVVDQALQAWESMKLVEVEVSEGRVRSVGLFKP